MTTSAVTAVLPARRNTRPGAVVLLLLCIGLLTTLQGLALGSRNPISDTLSSYVHVSGGWLFGAALLVLAVGLIELARQLGAGRRVVQHIRVMLWAAALSATLAAFFPADRSDAVSASLVGDLHKWSSISLLVLMSAATVATVIAGVSGARVRRPVTALLALAATSGAVFLAGQLTKWSAGGQAALADQAPWAGGLTQRILVLSLVCALIVVSDDLSRSARAVATNSAAAPGNA